MAEMPTVLLNSNSTTWTIWTTDTTASSTISPWPYWAQATTGTAATTSVWHAWTGNGTALAGQVSHDRVFTDEQLAEMRRADAERQAARDEAKERARVLLESVLDTRQRRELRKDGHFHVQTKDGERVYRLTPGSAPVRIKGEDGHRYSYCIHPLDYDYPAADTTAAQKLLLDADEERFLQIANRTRLGRVEA